MISASPNALRCSAFGANPRYVKIALRRFAILTLLSVSQALIAVVGSTSKFGGFWGDCTISSQIYENAFQSGAVCFSLITDSQSSSRIRSDAVDRFAVLGEWSVVLTRVRRSMASQ